jgi:hypothetical protein
LKLTSLAHYLGGFLSGLCSLFNPTLSVLATLLFLVYELDEDWQISDESFSDIREYLLGLFISLILVVVKGFA